MKLHIKSNENVSEESETFNTFEVSNIADVLSAHRYVSNIEEKRALADKLFAFFQDAYDEIGGFRSFKDIDRFVNDSYLWYITYKGQVPADKSNLDLDRIFVVSVYRKNHGLKMAGMARRKLGGVSTSREENMNIRRLANAALIQHIKFSLKRGWAEVSGDLEMYYARIASPSDIIDPYEIEAHKIFKDVHVMTDEFHYKRPLRRGGPMLVKIAYGTIQW